MRTFHYIGATSSHSFAVGDICFRAAARPLSTADMGAQSRRNRDSTIFVDHNPKVPIFIFFSARRIETRLWMNWIISGNQVPRRWRQTDKQRYGSNGEKRGLNRLKIGT